jgi:hypothetical protein
MPHILFDQRGRARSAFIAGRGIQEPNSLAFLVADAIDAFVGTQYDWNRLKDARGAVESALDEFKREVMDPYEARKSAENGTAFPLSKVHGGPE